MWSTTKWFRFIPEAGGQTGVQTGGLWEVYGRSPDKTSRAGTLINTGVSKGYGRSDAFFGLRLFFQDPVGSVFCF